MLLPHGPHKAKERAQKKMFGAAPDSHNKRSEGLVVDETTSTIRTPHDKFIVVHTTTTS